MTKLYRPSNQSEGSVFEADYCYHCVNESVNEMSGEIDACDIHLRAISFDIEDPAYPTEWTYDEHHKPVCTAFTTDNNHYRCTRTVDMFEPLDKAARDYIHSQFSGPITKVRFTKPDEGFLKCCRCGCIARFKENMTYDEQCTCIHEECDGQMMCNKWPNWRDGNGN